MKIGNGFDQLKQKECNENYQNLNRNDHKIPFQKPGQLKTPLNKFESFFQQIWKNLF